LPGLFRGGSFTVHRVVASFSAALAGISPTMEFALARYRLRFKHPFGTAHGLRDGTDSVFVRIRRKGFVGYGEATLPPYLNETQDSVNEELECFWLKFGTGVGYG
jgi:hypothetical protein